MTSLLPLSEIFNPHPGWYRGDFHCHTHHSDGVLTPPELAQLGRGEGLDFFAITDHNTIQAYGHFGEHPGLLIIPGVEVTYKDGHFNVFGIEQAEDWLAQMDYVPGPRAEDRFASINALMERSASLGLLNSINHPLLKPWAWEFPETELAHLRCLEIWNDPSWPDNQRDNPRAIQLWTEWLNDGWRITGIGGSDYHRPVPPPNPPKPPDRLGLPSTYVYASELSGHAILEGLRQRRVYVSMGPRVTFQAHAGGATYDIGADLGVTNGEIHLSAAVSDCTDQARAQIVKNGRALTETPVESGKASLQCADRADTAQTAWYRFDVYDPGGRMLAITNPIFAGPPRAPDRRTFGAFVGDPKSE